MQDPELAAPLGIAVLGNRVIVSASPNLLVYFDDDGDDRADRKEVLLSGFGGKDSDHGLHAALFGPDGLLYLNAGNSGPHEVRDRAGVTVRSNKAGKPVRPGDDGKIWVQGLDLRVGLDGRGLEVIAHNFRNAYELAVDAFGNVWQNDNDDDGNESCRMTFVAEGGNYGFSSLDGQRTWRADHRSGQSTPSAHWHLDDPGTMPTTEITGAGSPTGIAVYERDLLPARFRGAILNAEAGRGVVWAHAVKRAGAGWASSRADLVAAREDRGDEARRFRPSDVAVGPDGAVYVADWYDPMVGGHDMHDRAGHGRILRVAPPGFVSRPRVDVSTPAGAASALLSPAPSARYLGWEALRAAGPSARGALAARAADPDPRVRARITFALAALGGEAGRADARKALRDPDADVRTAALRALARTAPAGSLPGELLALAGDPDPAVRRELALALRKAPVEATRAPLLRLAAAYDGVDRAYLEALGVAAAGKEQALWPALVAKLGHRDPRRWSPRFAALAWRLHPKSAVPALAARAADGKLAPEERRRSLVALAFAGAEGAAAVVRLAEKGDAVVRSAAVELALVRGGQEWRGLGLDERIARLGSTAPAAPSDAGALASWKAALLSPATRPEERAKALDALAASPEGGRFLVGLAQQKKVGGELAAEIAGRIFRNPDLGVRALASQYFQRPAFDGARFPPIAELAKMKGDAARGKAVFFGAAACGQCHEHGGQGRAIGPALTQVGTKMGKEALFDAILNPSAGIAFGYDPWVVVTRDQRTFNGFVLADGDSVLLKDLAGERHLIPARDIVHRQKETTSFMPDNIALGMKPQELVDLVEFLVRSTGATEK